ncbi:MAG TPA: molybdopterin converting factor subunit 1 [Spirochaetota bacterium]|nr:molybdopterin converting factor subunit 1 [Spirochaetota bacterium]HPF06246.1 molybdopterin converting factor subunit 1 [Spirochaetota bacterium]HPJ41429.1 molybdopterin converting factor subunit 1 [Spirochaetota bacterium]HPR36470.1 molybdopterin converting factor subunit 1 [Spirochaetota bacterium]HRX47855.1 molybdopterin converting factor subunit 1 [Spirochaetota bacterium]
MTKIRLKLFASLKDICGFSERDFSFEKPSSVNDLIDELAALYPAVSEKKGILLIAVNEEYTDAGTILKDGDTVAIFPPVSGG